METSLDNVIRARILERIAEPDCSFVFPSQLAADLRAVGLCRDGILQAVDPDRFIGWDRFKEHAFGGWATARPATKVLRKVWAAGILGRQRQEVFLDVMLGPGEPSPRFLGFLATLAPNLDTAIRAAGDRGHGRSAEHPGQGPAGNDAEPTAATQGSGASSAVLGTATSQAAKSPIPPEIGAGAAPPDSSPRQDDAPPMGGEAGRFLRDLRRLYADYVDFLKRNSLFEPSWQPKRTPRPGSSYLVFAPELIEDFEDFAPLLAHAPGVRTIPLKDLTGDGSLPGTALARFPNAREELRWVFGTIAQLIEIGISPDDIIVSSTDTEKAAPLILRTAGEWAIPCSLASGFKLSGTPYGRLLAAAASCGERDFDFPTVRDLLLDQGIPWKKRELNRSLVRYALERHIQAGYGSGKDRVDIWHETFRRCPPPPGIEEHWKRLAAGLATMTKADSFDGLRDAFMRFRRNFLDESGMVAGEAKDPAATEAPLQRIVEEMTTLCEMDGLVGLWPEQPSRLSFLLAHLEEQTYVPQRSGQAVRVYAYRVSALADARHHFVLGCSEDGTRISYRRGGALPDFLRSRLELVDKDASSDFLRAHLCAQGAVGCFAEEDFSGWCAPPDEVGAVAEPDSLQAVRGCDPALGETAAWKDGTALPERLCAWQIDAVLGERPGGAGKSALTATECTAPCELDGLGRLPLKPAFPVTTCAAPPAASWPGLPGMALLPGSPPLLSHAGEDYAHATAGEKSLAAVLATQENEAGQLRLSTSGLKDYALCPFSWLVRRVLGLREQETATTFFDARLAGELAHDLIRRLYERIAIAGPYDPRRAPEYRCLLPDLEREVMASFTRKKGPFLEPMAEAYLPLLRHRIGRLLDEETQFAGWNPGRFETESSRAYTEERILLEGRADRVANNGQCADAAAEDGHPGQGGNLAIIDYKKKKLPTKGGLRLRQAGGPQNAVQDDEEVVIAEGWQLGERQIAAYIRLFETEERHVSLAAFYSIEEAAWLRVIGPEALATREEYEAELEAFDSDLRRAARGIRNGDFRIAPPPGKAGATHCENCPWRRLCRSHYATE